MQTAAFETISKLLWEMCVGQHFISYYFWQSSVTMPLYVCLSSACMTNITFELNRHRFYDKWIQLQSDGERWERIFFWHIHFKWNVSKYARTKILEIIFKCSASVNLTSLLKYFTQRILRRNGNKIFWLKWWLIIVESKLILIRTLCCHL